MQRYDIIGIMKIPRAFKVRLYPASEQARFLNKTPGGWCFLYNLMLSERIETYRTVKDNREAFYARRYFASCVFEGAQDRRFGSSKTRHVCGCVKKDVPLSEAAINPQPLGNNLPIRPGEVTSMDTAAPAIENESETAVEKPAYIEKAGRQ